jgi:hypothetical protein
MRVPRLGADSYTLSSIRVGGWPAWLGLDDTCLILIAEDQADHNGGDFRQEVRVAKPWTQEARAAVAPVWERIFCVSPAGPPSHDELQHQCVMLARLGGQPGALRAPACYGYTRHLLTIA